MARTISNTESGERAWAFVLLHARCPYCAKALVDLPRATPVYDVACSRCAFRRESRSAAEVSLFPLVPWSHVRERTLPPNHATMAGRLMVDYHDLKDLPHFTLYTAL
jgi:hypothetical protein